MPIALIVGAVVATVLKPNVIVMTTFPVESSPWLRGFGWTSELTWLNGGCDPPQPLFWDSCTKVLHACIGMGPQRSSASVTAIGMDPRLDTSESYWMLSGIGRVDPKVGSLTSANWVHSVVDGDYSYYFDPREKKFPPGWETGVFPQLNQTELGVPTAPYEPRSVPEVLSRYNVWQLSPTLVNWAVMQSANMTLPDADGLRDVRQAYASEYPAAAAPPRVFMAASISGARYWAGDTTLAWARNWTCYWTKGSTTLGTSAEEDSGVVTALSLLSAAGGVKPPSTHLLILRTGSDFLTPPSSSEDDLATWFASPTRLWAVDAANTAFLVGSHVTRALTSGPPGCAK